MKKTPMRLNEPNNVNLQPNHIWLKQKLIQIGSHARKKNITSNHVIFHFK